MKRSEIRSVMYVQYTCLCECVFKVYLSKTGIRETEGDKDGNGSGPHRPEMDHEASHVVICTVIYSCMYNTV